MRGLLVMLAACWTSTQTAAPQMPEPPPEQPAPTVRDSHRRSPCEVAVQHALDVSHDEIDKLPADFVEKLPQLLVDSCTETSWSEDTLRCFDESTDTSALGNCQRDMTPEQTSDIMRRVTEAFPTHTP